MNTVQLHSEKPFLVGQDSVVARALAGPCPTLRRHSDIKHHAHSPPFTRRY